jgi:hypothetical protein
MNMTTKLNIKDLVGNGKKVRLERYQSGVLTYVAEGGFKFQVPVADLGDAQALPEESAMTFMKWIKKALVAFETEEETNQAMPG